MNTKNAHTWRFFRAGGFDQVKLDTGADLQHLDQLDQKLWVALACPTSSLEFDPKTAALVDSDGDGRIRAPELLAAVRWACTMLKNPDDLVRGGDSLPLAAINDATPEGKQLLASARQICANLGKPDATAITLADACDANRTFANTTFNGDGVIIPESASDDETRAVINDIIACVGPVSDRSGKPGVDAAKVEAFFTECAAFDAWMKQAEADAKTILPLGEATAAASAAVRAIKSKLDDYFGRCRLAAYDPRALTALNRREEEYLAVAARDLSITVAEIAGFPLAPIAPGKPLPLSGPVNPAHAAAVAALREQAVKPLLGDRTELTEADWLALQARLAPFDSWQTTKHGAAVEKLGIARVRAILSSPARKRIEELIAKDKALEPEATAIANVEKLCRYVRDLHTLCINFVNFRNFYEGQRPAIFQCGSLYLDQRSCALCLPVEDAGRHAALAGLAGAYLAYCDCTRKATGEKRSIVAVFTQGDDDHLLVGRNGVFYDRQGRDWDATITKIVSNPISLRQAFWMPYKKLVRFIEEQIAKRAAAAEAASTAKLESTAATVATADKAKPAEAKKVDVGTVAALGVAFGALSTAIAYFMGLFKGIAPWQFPLILIGLMLLISGPSLILAYMKLRKRNLGPILDANGWAVNARARINVPFGASLTRIAKLPPGASVDMTDRYAEKSALWPRVLLVIFLLWWIHSYLYDQGWLHRITGGSYGRPPAELRESGAAPKDAAAKSPADAPKPPE
ncbi:MAG: hypothetical protein N3I86_01785 [Verrucomicrobiae bacterium]|nr:hypothetical protein [Verrucomicrobiae bacterium]MDW8307751.1 hypothetical protein [Verrucomicrobiales bacterium]